MEIGNIMIICFPAKERKYLEEKVPKATVKIQSSKCDAKGLGLVQIMKALKDGQYI